MNISKKIIWRWFYDFEYFFIICAENQTQMFLYALIPHYDGY